MYSVHSTRSNGEKRRKGVVSKVPLCGSVPVGMKSVLEEIMEAEKKTYSDVIVEAISDYLEKKLGD